MGCKNFVWSIGLLLFNSASYGQHTLTGIVRDAQSLSGLEGASVYFPELLRGSASIENGTFSIPMIKPGQFLLQVSHVGYETKFVRVLLRADTTIEITLKASHIQMQEVVIRGNQNETPLETSFNIAQLSNVQMTQTGSLSVSDAIAKLPGVSQLTTGPGISKPVIRGLYGNRIQVTMGGIRFDNQQWQDEHGLGLSDMGVDRVEVIRGPASVLYGSEAMGGVLNIIDEKPAPVNTTLRELNTRLFSNTYGLSVNYGVRKTGIDRWSKLRFGFDNHADYDDGKGNRVLNSRFASYNLKASWGKTKENSTHVNSVMGSYSLFGFVFDSLNRKTLDGRLSRKFDGPHHIVGFAQYTSDHSYFKQGRKTSLKGGFISNLRMEDEGGGGISLSMLLNTLNVLGQVTRNFGTAGEWTYGTSVMFQTNTNFGGRIIVPNAINGETSVFTFYKQQVGKLLLEGGGRYDFKFIRTFATSTLNVPGGDSPPSDIAPFSNGYNAFNVSGGINYSLTRALAARLNASTGYRPGNLAELSSNGLHEGTLRWEIGLPGAKLEQNLNVEGSLVYSSSLFRASASVYQNKFRNYFYLAPTGTEFYGFAVYHYKQTNATLRGYEVMLDWNPGSSLFSFNTSYSYIEAKKDDGTYLPFIPANRLSGEVNFHFRSSGVITSPSFKLGGTYAFNQNHPAEFETPTNSYFLLNAGFAARWKNVEAWITGTNLLDNYYFDHLSRFKYYGIANMGRNIVLGLGFKL